MIPGRAWPLALVLLAATAAGAGEPDPLLDARQHYERGMAHYEVGEFAQAIDEFKIAYEASRAPGLLFNLAQAHRLAKQYEQALHLYRSYLRARPDAPNRADAESRITELERLVAAQHQREQTPAEPSPPPAAIDAHAATLPPTAPIDKPALVEPLPPRRRNGRAERIAGISVGAVGIVALALGIYFGSAALDAQHHLNNISTWDATAQSLYSSGHDDAVASTTLFVAGGVAVVTGGTLYLLGWRDDARARRFAVAPAGAGVACAF